MNDLQPMAPESWRPQTPATKILYINNGHLALFKLVIRKYTPSRIFAPLWNVALDSIRP